MGFLYSQLFVTPQIRKGTSFAGQTVIITGANTGLGKEAARHVARLGVSKLIITARRVKAGEEARDDIIQTTGCPATAIEVWHLDLSSYDSVKAFASRAAALARLDVLIEGAGIATGIYAATASSGHESTITTNVISTFLLALLILPTLRASAQAHDTTPRLVIVSSEVHAWTSFPERSAPSIFAALSDPSTKTMRERYQTSKLLEVLVVRALAPQLLSTSTSSSSSSSSSTATKSPPVILNMLNPGLNKTTLGGGESWLLAALNALLGRRVDVGARTYVAAAAAGRESHGRYMTDALVDDGALSGFVRSAEGKAVGVRVWEELRGILEEIQPGVVKAAMGS